MKSNPTPVEETAVDLLDCGHCGVPMGEWCIQKSGRRHAPDLHAVRVNALNRLASTSYADGARTTLGWIVDEIVNEDQRLPDRYRLDTLAKVVERCQRLIRLWS